jgi:hypothetical protein
MNNKNDEENLVSLKAWQQKKAEEARKAERQKARNIGGGPLAAKLVLAAFVLLILWLAMPAGYLAILTHTFTGG